MEDVDNGTIVKDRIFNYSPAGLIYPLDNQTLPEDGAFIKLASTPVANTKIDDLWSQYSRLVGNEAPISLTLELVDVLKGIFAGDFKNWLYVQIVSNRKITKEVLNYLHDSLVFVSGGCRSVSQSSWRVLLDNSEVSTLSAEDKIALFNDVNIPNVIDLLADWVKQPGGIDDLFQTAKILFGTK